ncbi:hypothetical protein HCN44_001604 [Aphidius gifuensis]|uniref:Sulfatase N-terminal domain-containing protein n=1 Tax=Aphidius gifuensis TaxID=684658 RepID=A0A835CPV4_APHGI|nr:arylsulfatase B-like [Aphidius gifuensis]KAF7992279.1 hypothetical protein HCN44_001604 [Aphidius gifuensis]
MTINLHKFLFILIIFLMNNHVKVDCFAKAKTPPNIIVMMADDLGWNDVSFHGSNQIPTPNIDALAYNGVILKNHYVLPICTPSRSAFFTGRYPIRDGMQGYPLKAGEPRGIPLSTKLLPQHLKSLGYSTNLVGKWHLGYYKDNFTPARRGFDTFYGYYNGYITYFNHTITESNRTGYDFRRDTPRKLEPLKKSDPLKYATDVFTDEAVEIITKHNKSQPLYLQISHLAPHASDAVETLETRDINSVNKEFGYIRDSKRRKFAGMMKALDESVGSVTEALSKNGLMKNSIIIFMADNGAQTIGFLENHGSNYPFRGLKFTLFEGGVHGVACVYSPLINKTGRVINDMMHITDWLPTLYKQAGGVIKNLGTIDGINQWSIIKNGKRNDITRQGRKSVLINIDEKQQQVGAIRGKWKLIKGEKNALDGYYRENISDVGFNDSEYVAKVLNSTVNLVIKKIAKSSINEKQILNLRQESQITCKPLDKVSSNCSNLCLFNIVNDPCETTDVSAEYPGVISNIENYISYYQSVLMNQTNAPVQPESFPEHFHGVWMPWLDNNVWK